MARDAARKKRQIELDDFRTFARIDEEHDGGPIIDLVTGREPHPVGTIVCVKAGMRAVTWESMRAERPMIALCEVASPVTSLISQPHEIFMKVTGQSREWVYRPDLMLTVDADFAAAVLAGQPFSEAVCDWRPGAGRRHDVKLVVEVKDDSDRRINDPAYLLKLDLARKAYARINWQFITVIRSRDIDNAAISKSVRHIMLDHDVALSPGDLDLVRAAFGSRDVINLDELTPRLGGTVRGLARCAALHVRRIISIDLRHDLCPTTPVTKLPDDMAIFEMSGRTQW